MGDTAITCDYDFLLDHKMFSFNWYGSQDSTFNLDVLTQIHVCFVFVNRVQFWQDTVELVLHQRDNISSHQSQDQGNMQSVKCLLVRFSK